MKNRTGIDDAVLETFASVVTPALTAEKPRVEAKGYHVTPIDGTPRGQANVGLKITRPPATSSVTIAFYWSEIDGVWEEDLRDSDPDSDHPDVLHKTLTPDIVKRAVARAASKLDKLIAAER